MQNVRGLTLVEAIVIITLVALLLAGLMPQCNRVYPLAQQAVCRTNLKGVGTGVLVYSNDYDGAYPIQGGSGQAMWKVRTDGWYNADTDWATARDITVGASLYLLVRNVEINPRSFVCQSSGQSVYEGQNPNNLDITELWDFGEWGHNPAEMVDDGIGSGHGPKNHVSYAYHMPYGLEGGGGELAAGKKRPAAFAVMADKNPWFDPRLKAGGAPTGDWMDYDHVSPMGAYEGRRASRRWEVRRANTYAHGREGQNVLFADGHCSFEKTADVGVGGDNIYTRRGEGGSEDAIRIGNPDEMPNYTIDNKWQPRDENDSFLVNDDSRLAAYGLR